MLEGSGVDGGRAAGAAVPVDASRSVSRIPAAPQSRLGPRARVARARERHGPRRRGVGGGAADQGSGAGGDPAVVVRDQARRRHRSARARQHLVLGGYEPADPVDAHGEFARRGGILDVFPAGEELPIRIEFIGDTVESIRRFDPGTQRSVETLDRFGIVPVRERRCLRDLAPLHVESVSVPAYARRAGVAVRANRCGKPHQERPGNRSRTSYADAVERSKGAEPPRRRRAPARDGGRIAARARQRALSSRSSRSGIRDRGLGDSGRWQLSVQPTATFHGRIPDWIADVKAAQAERRSRRVRRRLARPRRAHR